MLYPLRHILLSVAMSAVVSGGMASAQAQDVEEQPDHMLRQIRPKVFKGYYHPVIDGDTVLMIVFNDINVYPPPVFKNKKQEEFYWRTVRDVRKALPYAKLISETLGETYEYLQTFDTPKERESYLKEMEGEVFNQYKPYLKKFTKNQAKVLVKLIGRETNQSGYALLKAFLGTTRAMFYHGFGKLFGVNINAGYDPAKNKDDALVDRIATLIEQGQL